MVVVRGLRALAAVWCVPGVVCCLCAVVPPLPCLSILWVYFLWSPRKWHSLQSEYSGPIPNFCPPYQKVVCGVFRTRVPLAVCLPQIVPILRGILPILRGIVVKVQRRCQFYEVVLARCAPLSESCTRAEDFVCTF